MEQGAGPRPRRRRARPALAAVAVGAALATVVAAALLAGEPDRAAEGRGPRGRPPGATTSPSTGPRTGTSVAGPGTPATSAGPATVAPATTAPTGRPPATVARPLSPLVLDVPAGIAADCSVDVTRALADWIAAAPDGAVLRLGRRACYRVDRSLRIVDRTGLTIEGNGATLRAVAEGDQDRRHVWVIGGSGLTVRDLTVRGANPAAGADRDEAYRENRAFQHGFALQGVRQVVLERVQAYDVYGDFVYVGPDTRLLPRLRWSAGVVVRGSRFERNGRQGIAIVAGEDVLVTGNHIGDVRRSTFDLEPDSARGGARRVRIVGNTTGRGRLLWVASGGQGAQISDITIADNVMQEPTGVPVLLVRAPDDAGLRGPIVVERNRLVVADSPRAAIECRGCTGLTVRANTARFPPESRMTAVSVRRSEHVVVEGNAFAGAAVVLDAGPGSGDVRQSANTTS